MIDLANLKRVIDIEYSDILTHPMHGFFNGLKFSYFPHNSANTGDPTPVQLLQSPYFNIPVLI